MLDGRKLGLQPAAFRVEDSSRQALGVFAIDSPTLTQWKGEAAPGSQSMPDIAQPGTSRALAFEEVSRPASFALPQARPIPKPPGFWARHWRRLLAVALVGTAGAALLQQQMILATEHAVISAYTMPVRTPIGGEITDLAARAGEEIIPGLAFARVENPRADRGRLLDLTAERDRARDEVGALIGQISALEGLAADIRARGQDHREFSALHLAAQAREAMEWRAAALARAQRAGQEAARASELARAGHGSQAARERAEAELESARREAAAHGARIAALERQAGAAASGVFTELGHVGASYAEQRLDDIALRRGELAREASRQQSALERAERRLTEERALYETQRVALLNPMEGLTVWRLKVQPGQRVGPEDVLAEVLDCRSIFILAAVPQTALPSLAPGSAARFRLAGEREARPGIVLGRHGEASGRDGTNLAAQPSRPHGLSALVQIALEPFQPGTLCPVGRTGRVHFDSIGFAMPRLW